MHRRWGVCRAPLSLCRLLGSLPTPETCRKKERVIALEDAKTQVDQAFTRDDLRGLSFENAFGGATSFLRRRYSKVLSGVDLEVTGILRPAMAGGRPPDPRCRALWH